MGVGKGMLQKSEQSIKSGSGGGGDGDYHHHHDHDSFKCGDGSDEKRRRGLWCSWCSKITWLTGTGGGGNESMWEREESWKSRKTGKASLVTGTTTFICGQVTELTTKLFQNRLNEIWNTNLYKGEWNIAKSNSWVQNRKGAKWIDNEIKNTAVLRSADWKKEE